MKILFISPSPLVKTGLGKVVHHLTKGLVERGYEVHVANNQYGGQPIIIDGIIHHPLLGGFDHLPIILDDIQPDVAVAYYPNWVPPFTEISSICASKDIKLLWYVTIEFDELNLDYLTSLVGANAVATPSQHGVKLLKRHRIPAIQIPHGVDHTVYKPINPKPIVEGREDEFIYMMVARNQLRKDYPTLLKAFAKLPKEIRENSTLYLHTLPLEESYGTVGWNLPELIMRLGLTERVVMPSLKASKWLGYTEQEMAQIYNAADVNVLVTSGEGFALPIVESMACGKPQIVSENTALPEVAGDAALYAKCWSEKLYTAEGFAINQTKESCLIRCMQTAYEDRNLLKKLSEKALERAKHFTWEKAVTQLEKALEEATKSPRLTMEILKQKKPINAPAYHPNLLKHIPQGKGLCLDAGCGRYAPYRKDIEAKGYKWIGVDTRSGKDIQQIDLTNLPLPFKDKQFEYAWCCHVIEHMPKSKQPKLIQELKRVAKHGCIVAPAPNTPAYHLDPLHKGLNQKILKSREATTEGGNIIIKW